MYSQINLFLEIIANKLMQVCELCIYAKSKLSLSACDFTGISMVPLCIMMLTTNLSIQKKLNVNYFYIFSPM